MSTVFMFPGQGCQYLNMGHHFFRNEAVFRECMLQIDDLLRSNGGGSVVDYIYSNANEHHTGAGDPTEMAFGATSITHPAIFSIEVSLARLVMSKGVEPDYVLGSSLGEVAAAVIAEMLSLAEGLSFVVEQARIFERRCRPGCMLAVLGEPRLQTEIPALREGCELAAINYDQHFVVSAAPSAVPAIEHALRSARILFHRLPVTHGFHSSLIDDARSEFEELQRGLPLREPSIRFVSCTHGWRDNVGRTGYDFWSVVRKPLDVPMAIAQVERAGATDFLDLGPSGSLANFGKRCARKGSPTKFVPMLTPFAAERDVDDVIASLSKSTVRAPGKTRERVAWMFPGQGSQHPGMGRELFEEFREFLERADSILGYSVRDLCMEQTGERLNDTRFTQPALFVVNALSWMHFRRNVSALPDYLLGHSLGEFNALFAAGAFDFETGVRLVKHRAEAMATVEGGGMSVVLGMEREALADLLRSSDLEGIDIANLNAPGQIVIAGPRPLLERAGALLQEQSAQYLSLNVSGPFHSRYMQPARSAFRAHLLRESLRNPEIPVISNVYAAPYVSGAVAAHLEEQITAPVQWTASVRHLLEHGVSKFEQIGPGKILTNLVAKIRLATERQAPTSPATSTPRSAIAPCPPERVSARGSASEHAGRLPLAAGGQSAADALGSAAFRREYGVRRAYVAGAMYKGIASVPLVMRMARAGYLSFFGTGGLQLSVVEDAIRTLRRELANGEPFGMNLVCNLTDPNSERDLVELFLRESISVIEAAAFMHITPALVLYRARGLSQRVDGGVRIATRVIAKVSRPEVAAQFLEPAPERIVRALLDEGAISSEQAACAARVLMADDLVAEADSGGHTDMGVAQVMLPTFLRQRDAACAKRNDTTAVRVGAAGGIGTPEAAAAAFVLGADFILTGSINQCTPEAHTSDLVKDMLQEMNIQDTAYAPAGDMFKIGAKVQVLKRGVFFPARANKLHELYRSHGSLEDLDETTRRLIQEKYFKRSFDEVWAETSGYYGRAAPDEVAKADRDPKYKMELIFRWYFIHTMRLAKQGHDTERVDFQVHCGPALGAFNQWVKGTELESWRNRHVDVIADRLMTATGAYLEARFRAILRTDSLAVAESA